ncbi:hypothetical protein RZS08_59340, partial [Arthrospira platensis SPKY1]|nr:hypothetical protein [Arthrospira platensis SPKY1]
MITCGIDAGSRMIKVAILDSGTILASGQTDQGVQQTQRASDLVETLLRRAAMAAGDIARTVA